VFVHPPENGREDEALPRLEPDIRRLPLAADVRQGFDESANVFAPIDIEAKREITPLCALEFV